MTGSGANLVSFPLLNLYCCWQCRNPKANHLGCHKTFKNNGETKTAYQPQLVSEFARFLVAINRNPSFACQFFMWFFGVFGNFEAEASSNCKHGWICGGPKFCHCFFGPCGIARNLGLQTHWLRVSLCQDPSLSATLCPLENLTLWVHPFLTFSKNLHLFLGT